MAWRPHELLIEGELTNRVRGRVTGHLLFRGLAAPVVVVLDGDFHRDIRGATIRLSGINPMAADEEKACEYMEGFSCIQTGNVGDITAGKEPFDYVDYPYIEWFSKQNGRVVLELEHEQLSLIGEPLSWKTETRINPDVACERCKTFLADVARALAIHEQ